MQCGTCMRFGQESHHIPVSDMQIALQPHQNWTFFWSHQNRIAWVFTPMRSNSANGTVFCEPISEYRQLYIHTRNGLAWTGCDFDAGRKPHAANSALHQCEPGQNVWPALHLNLGCNMWHGNIQPPPPRWQRAGDPLFPAATVTF